MPSKKQKKPTAKPNRKTGNKAAMAAAPSTPAQPMTATSGVENPTMAKKGTGQRKRNARARSARA